MPTVVISDPSFTLATDSTCFTLRANKRLLTRLPFSLLDRIIVFHGVELTRNALERLGDLGIPLTLLDAEGRVKGRLVAPWKHSAIPRLEQARCWHDPALRLLLAKRWVRAKLLNSARQLHRYTSNYRAPTVSEAAAEIEGFATRVSLVQDHDALRGIEGAAGRAYFHAFRHMLRVKWTAFNGRNRQPPLDPVNATLSFVYTVFCNRLHAYVEACGLDPSIGYLHSVQDHRPNLALDLIEPFRAPLADRLVLRLFNLGQLRAEHFQPPAPSGAVYLNSEGRKTVLAQLEPWTASCDDELDVPAGTSHPTSPDRLLQLETDRYRALAAAGTLDAFSPYCICDLDT